MNDISKAVPRRAKGRRSRRRRTSSTPIVLRQTSDWPLRPQPPLPSALRVRVRTMTSPASQSGLSSASPSKMISKPSGAPAGRWNDSWIRDGRIFCAWQCGHGLEGGRCPNQGRSRAGGPGEDAHAPPNLGTLAAALVAGDLHLRVPARVGSARQCSASAQRCSAAGTHMPGKTCVFCILTPWPPQPPHLTTSPSDAAPEPRQWSQRIILSSSNCEPRACAERQVQRPARVGTRRQRNQRDKRTHLDLPAFVEVGEVDLDFGQLGRPAPLLLATCTRARASPKSSRPRQCQLRPQPGERDRDGPPPPKKREKTSRGSWPPLFWRCLRPSSP